MSNRSRKTMDVEELKAFANRALAAQVLTPGQAVSPTTYRVGVISMLEFVLHETGNYNGFNYLPSEKNDDGTLRYYY